MKDKLSELKAAFVLLLITAVVGISGMLLYNNLSSVSAKVAGSFSNGTLPSQIMRQMLADCRDAENSIKSYNLTGNDGYLETYYSAVRNVYKGLRNLRRKRTEARFSKEELDSIAVLVNRRVSLLDKQLYLEDEKKIAGELNKITGKLKGTGRAGTKAWPDTAEGEGKGFIKNAFTRKKRKGDSLARAMQRLMASESALDSMAKELSITVQSGKNSLYAKLRQRQNEELLLAEEGRQLMDRIRNYYNVAGEDEKRLAEIRMEQARDDMNDIKVLGIIVSVVVSLLLLTISILMVIYWRRKQQYEQALLKAREKAEEHARAKEFFLASMSHEIRTPLNAIYGFTEQVLNADLQPAQREQLGIVKRSAAHLIRLIADILNYSKIEAGKMKAEPVSFALRQELRDIETLLAPGANAKNVKLVFGISASVPEEVYCDLTKLRQILMNLAGNAIKFTQQGFVYVKVKNHKSDEPALYIIVSDTGIGIPAGRLGMVFNEYEQAHPGLSGKYGGTGLGLAITRRLTELMGGSIDLKSEEGKGTEVRLVIPYEKPQPEQPGQAPGQEPEAPPVLLAGKVVLIADDEEYNRLLIKTVLSRYGVEVATAVNGQDAVTQVAARHFDLVIMDLNMPVMNGIAACRTIRHSGAEVPVLASTAAHEEDKSLEESDAGFSGFLYKPFTEQQLLHIVSAFLVGKTSGRPVIRNAPGKKAGSGKRKMNTGNIDMATGGDKKFRKEMLELFHKSVTEGLAGIKKLCGETKFAEASALAHKVMGPCRHMEADDLYAALLYFEKLKHTTPSPGELDEKLAVLVQEVQAIDAELKTDLSNS